MSKCREAFSGIYPTIPSGDIYFVWQAAWNAATKNAATVADQHYASTEAIEAILKEIEP